MSCWLDASAGRDVPVEVRADEGGWFAICIRSFVGRILVDGRSTRGASTMCRSYVDCALSTQLPEALASEACRQRDTISGVSGGDKALHVVFGPDYLRLSMRIVKRPAERRIDVESRCRKPRRHCVSTGFAAADRMPSGFRASGACKKNQELSLSRNTFMSHEPIRLIRRFQSKPGPGSVFRPGAISEWPAMSRTG